MDLKIINIFRLVLLEFFFWLYHCVCGFTPPPFLTIYPSKKRRGGGGIIERELLNKARFAFFLTKQHQLLRNFA